MCEYLNYRINNTQIKYIIVTYFYLIFDLIIISLDYKFLNLKHTSCKPKDV